MHEPYCLAMVLCDNVHQDPATGKFTLLGTFSTFAARQFPALVQFFVYSAITDGQGQVPIRLRLVDSAVDLSGDGNAVFDEVIGECDFDDPLMTLEMRTYLKLELPAPGVFHCEIYGGEKLLMSRRLILLDISKLDGEQSNDK